MTAAAVSAEKPLMAFTVHDGDDGWKIVFATSKVAARRMGADALGIEFGEVDYVDRSPEFDGYAPGPVPPLARIEHGWWYDCQHCGRRVTNSMYEDLQDEDLDPDDFQILVRGHTVYCSHACGAKADAEARAKDAARAALLDAFYAHYPDALAIHVQCWGKLLDVWSPIKDRADVVTFTFPGGQYAGRWVIGDDMCSISRHDEEAYRAWRGLKQEDQPAA